MGVTYYSDNKKAAKKADIIWLCINPSQSKEVLKELEPIVESQTIISIMISISQEYLKKFFPNSPVIRYMPTSLIKEGRGVTFLAEDSEYETKRITKELREWSSHLHVVEDEDMNFYTTLACGHIYTVVSFMSAISVIGKDFEKDIAVDIALEALSSIKDKNLGQIKKLRESTTTSAGIVESGLEELSSQQVKEVYSNAVKKTMEKLEKLQKKCED